MRKTINKEWYQNTNVRPKLINVTMERDARGGYRVIQGTLLNEINQYDVIPQRIDVRDLVADINSKGGVFSL